MAGILTTELEETVNPQEQPLIVLECLGEFNNGQKALARENLDVYPKDSVYTKTESDSKLNDTLKKTFERYLNEEDPHGILPEVRNMISDFIRNDGTTPFLAPLEGVDPIKDYHLTTKRFVSKLLNDHINTEDPHRILQEVEDILTQYVKLSEVYFKSQLYTKNEIDLLSGNYIKKDGTTPFTKALIGADPLIDSHLATKRYVDKVIYNHLVDVDPHGFIATLNNRLASYAKASNVYDKTLTYSRVLLDSIVRSLVRDAALEAINDHINTFDPHNILPEVKKQGYVKQNGTTPFKTPLKGVDAIDPQDLVTLHQVEEKISDTKEAIENLPASEWVTSGPVQATVGMINEGDTLASKISLLEAMDAIFYGKRVTLTVDELVNIGELASITLCIQGSLATVGYAEVYLNDLYVLTITKEELEESGCVTKDSLPITDETEIKVKVIYTNGSEHEVSQTVNVALPVFVGRITSMKFGDTLTYNDLKELTKEDSTNNKFYNKGEHLQSLEHIYNFDENLELKLVVAIPKSYNDLAEMYNSAQMVNVKAFTVITDIPFLVPGSETDIIYKIYFYKQDLFSLDTTMTFKFK